MKKILNIGAIGIALSLTATSLAQTKLMDIGRIVIDQYIPKDYESFTLGPGARIIAHFEPNENFRNQTCCNPNDVHWLQSLYSTTAIPGVSPFPNRRIIDPRRDQITPGSPTGRGDDMPFYDFTYNSLEDVEANRNIRVDGTGKFMQDTPRVAAGQTELTVSFTSVLVCAHEEKELCMLGGFRWGFTIDRNNKSTLTPIMALRPDEVYLGRYSDLNTPMRDDFNGYVVKNQKLCCPEKPMYVNVVPEPSSLVGMGIFSLGGMLLRRRRSISP